MPVREDENAQRSVMFIMPMGGPTMVSARFYLFGPHASGVALEYESAWKGWISQRFPANGASQGA